MSDLTRALDLIGRKEKPPMACCPRDGEPLISTIVFRYAEFYCLCCGRRYGFLDPTARDATPELSARHAELRAEWDQHVAGKIIIEGRESLANPDALAAHETALAWLASRADRTDPAVDQRPGPASPPDSEQADGTPDPLPPPSPQGS